MGVKSGMNQRPCLRSASPAGEVAQALALGNDAAGFAEGRHHFPLHLHVRVAADPADQLAFPVLEGRGPGVEPAVLTVVAADAQVDAQVFAPGDAAFPGGVEAALVLRVDLGHPGPAQLLACRPAGVFLPLAAEKVAAGVRRRRPDQLLQGIAQLAQLVLAFLQGLLVLEGVDQLGAAVHHRLQVVGQGLVVAAGPVGQADAADDAAVAEDGQAEEGLHGRMPGRDAVVVPGMMCRIVGDDCRAAVDGGGVETVEADELHAARRRPGVLLAAGLVPGNVGEGEEALHRLAVGAVAQFGDVAELAVGEIEDFRQHQGEDGVAVVAPDVGVAQAGDAGQAPVLLGQGGLVALLLPHFPGQAAQQLQQQQADGAAGGQDDEGGMLLQFRLEGRGALEAQGPLAHGQGQGHLGAADAAAVGDAATGGVEAVGFA